MQPTVCFVMLLETLNVLFKDLQDLLDFQECLDIANGLAPVKMLWMWWSTSNVSFMCFYN